MYSPLKTVVGKRIREARLKVGLTQEALSEKAGVDYKYLQRMEGKTPPNLKLETIEKLAKALKACKKDRSRSKRQKCEAKAHKQFGPVKKAKAKPKKKKR